MHICQYDVLGIDGFAREYTNGYVDGNYEYLNIPMEQDAFDYQRLDDTTTPIVSKWSNWSMKKIVQCK